MLKALVGKGVGVEGLGVLGLGNVDKVGWASVEMGVGVGWCSGGRERCGVVRVGKKWNGYRVGMEEVWRVNVGWSE